MKRMHTSVLTLACACLLALTACGGDSADTAADTAPSAVPPSSAAPSATSAAPDASAPSTASNADVVGDKKLCQSAQAASDEMRGAFVKAVQSGDTSAATMKKILGGLEEKMTELASQGGGDSKVAAALGKFSTEAGRAAAAKDPAAAADNPTFEKAGVDLTAACKTAGVNVTF
ncbi:hypothetical protein [Micromonospora sp. NPDC003241]